MLADLEMRIDPEGLGGGGAPPPHLTRALGLLGALLPELETAVRRHRLMTAVNLIALSLGEPARREEEGEELVVGRARFRAELVAMVVGLLGAPAVQIR